MSDPLSMTSSAVGVISMGLAVCGEIVTYARAWRDYNEDVHSIASKADSLRMPLKQLQEMIEETRVVEPEIAADLEEKAKSIHSSIDRLKQTIARYKPAIAPEGFSDKARVHFKRAVYPFRKETLHEMESNLDSIQHVLQTTLLVYFKQDTRTLLQEMKKMQSTLNSISEREMLPPSLLQSWCERQEQLSAWKSAIHMAAQDTSNKGGNQCSAQLPCAKPQLKAAARTYNHYSRWLNLTISASFSLVRGAGGASIAPTLHIQTVRSHLSSESVEVSGLEYRVFRLGQIDDTILQLKRLFSAGKLLPSDMFDWGTGNPYSLMDMICFPATLSPESVNVKQLARLIRFMLDCGAKPTSNSDNGPFGLAGICEMTRLTDEDVPLISHLVDLGARITVRPRSFSYVLKPNLRLILLKNNDLVEMPDDAKIIIREDEEELKNALSSGRILPNDKICNFSLLELAFGWPRGVQILLDSGADACQEFREITAKGEEYHHSAMLLLKAGCLFGLNTISASERCNDGGKRRSLLINELAARRKRLWAIAQASVPLDQLPPLNNDAILDVHAKEVCAALVAHRKKIPPSLQVGVNDCGRSVYHVLSSIKAMEAMYKIGFHDIDLPDSSGITPLMMVDPEHDVQALMKRVRWLTSKGADPHRRLPQSSATVVHFLNLKIVQVALDNIAFWPKSPEFQIRYREWESCISELGYGVFLLSPAQDSCVCSCSPRGCTALSVALRYMTFYLRIRSQHIADRTDCFRELVQFLINWNQDSPEAQQAILRSLTFNALGLTHACCIEIDDVYYPDNQAQGKDHDEISRILDEQELMLEDFEELLVELNVKFKELALPTMEYLEGYWQTRIAEYVLAHDPYNIEHVMGAKGVGVELVAEEVSVPIWVQLLFRQKVEELEYNH